MSVRDTIRKTLTATLALMVLLWAEAGLALLTGDQVMQCRTMPMMMHGAVHGMSAAGDAASVEDSDAMPCCPDEPGQVPKLVVDHPPCCASSDVPERPFAFLVSSERQISHPVDTVAEVAASFEPPLAQACGELRSSNAAHFVRPVLDLKSDLRI